MPVMSQTFTLVGTTSIISENYYPPIDINKSEYCLGLTGFHTYNTIPNIEFSINDLFYYDNFNKIQIPEGSYEIADIESYLQQQISKDKQISASEVNKFLSIKPNNNTLKVEIKSEFNIIFPENSKFCKLLGFSDGQILKANHLYESDLPVDIIKVSSVRVECNIVTGSYYNNKLAHTLFEFTPNVPPGYALNIEPRNIIYLPLNSNIIDKITVRILDQDSNLINFRGERIIIRLELKKC